MRQSLFQICGCLFLFNKYDSEELDDFFHHLMMKFFCLIYSFHKQKNEQRYDRQQFIGVLFIWGSVNQGRETG